MTNGVIDMPKYLLGLETTCVVQVSERASTFFFDTTMSEAKETIIIEDESEDDDTAELLSVEETCPIAR